MGQSRTLDNKFEPGRKAARRKRGMVHVLHRTNETQFTCRGPHVGAVPRLEPTQHERWYHPTKGWRWRRIG